MLRIVVVALVTASMAACGASDGGGTVAGPTPTRSATVSESPAASPTPLATPAPTPTPTPTSAPTPSRDPTPTPTPTPTPDTEPPALVVATPPAGATVANAEVVFRGTVEPGVQGVWSPPDHEAVVDSAGGWELTLTLPSGHHEVVFSTRDEAGNETVVVHPVTYTAPMPCQEFVIEAEHGSAYPVGSMDWCGGWGYIESVDADEIVFDLIQVELNVPGDESEGWSFVNENPMLRYLPLASTLEIRACPPEPGTDDPGICGNPWVAPDWGDFALWDVADLERFVAASDELWKVAVDPATGEVMWIEQWWNP